MIHESVAGPRLPVAGPSSPGDAARQSRPRLVIVPECGGPGAGQETPSGTVATPQPPSSLARNFPTLTVCLFFSFLFLTQPCMREYGLFSHSWILRGWNNDKKLLK